MFMYCSLLSKDVSSVYIIYFSFLKFIFYKFKHQFHSIDDFQREKHVILIAYNKSF